MERPISSRQNTDHGTVETAVVEGAPQIRLKGECDLATAPLLYQQVQQLVSSGHTRLVFDLQHVTFVDSSILRAFLSARRDLQPHGGEVVLLCRPGFVRRLLSLLELDRLVRVCTPEEWRQQIASVN